MMQIQGIGHALPGQPIEQADLLEVALRYNAQTPAERTRLKRIYRGSKVQRRHTVLCGDATDNAKALENVLCFYQPDANNKGPSTADRMRAYETHATPLAIEACEKALADSNTAAASITQLITVSCTGFCAPGQDAQLIEALGLSPSVGRTHIGFMGCHAAINAMRVADAMVRANPDERVLLCCTELCTLHFQYGNDPQDAIANALFADGSAALVAQNRQPASTRPATQSFCAEKIPSTQTMMAWSIGDHGFQMRLDPQVPAIIETTLRASLDNWLSGNGLTVDEIGGWLVHPGGPKIIDAVQAALGLKPAATDLSRQVLRDCGNMSSPTLLLILQAMMQASTPTPWVMLGFGPGLAIEAVLLV